MGYIIIADKFKNFKYYYEKTLSFFIKKNFYALFSVKEEPAEA